ncbi:hypothetical protein TNCV_5126251 [Trichonephila clavipes]|nr:hypothetical protein TNCV_5126251 [Trichonephila clavipes]
MATGSSLTQNYSRSQTAGENNSTRPLNSKTNTIAGEKQLNLAGENKSTRQHEQNNSTLHRLQPSTPPLQQNRLFLSTNVYPNPTRRVLQSSNKARATKVARHLPT